MNKIQIKCTCVCCGFSKTIVQGHNMLPMCDKCFSPMIPEKAKKLSYNINRHGK